MRFQDDLRRGALGDDVVHTGRGEPRLLLAVISAPVTMTTARSTSPPTRLTLSTSAEPDMPGMYRSRMSTSRRRSSSISIKNASSALAASRTLEAAHAQHAADHGAEEAIVVDQERPPRRRDSDFAQQRLQLLLEDGGALAEADAKARDQVLGAGRALRGDAMHDACAERHTADAPRCVHGESISVPSAGGSKVSMNMPRG